jgi:inhibitor of cysteine peptidase
VTLAPGQRLVVTLESNPSTGFGWQIGEAPDAAVLAQVGEPTYSPGGEAGMIGAGGSQVFTFVATGVGETGFTLAYRRSWEGGATDQFTLGVTVR